MGDRERENARKVREKAQNSNFNIISFLLYSFFLSPFSRIFAILSRFFAFSISPFLRFFCKYKKLGESIININKFTRGGKREKR
jgi:hypothetical protein